jgi:DNA mismatch endonuclease, patch repair protein
MASTRAAPSSPEASRRMQRVRQKNTSAELALRRELHALGLRYRIQVPVLTKPRRVADVTFAGPRVAVFIDGCFWHGCPEHGRRRAGANEWYWPGKIAGNVARDRDTDRRLADAGWRVVRVWEHDDVDGAADRVEAAVRAGRGGSGGGVADALPRRPA